MTAPIDLYFWPTPNGFKITIALEEMGLPYSVHFVDIGAGDQFKPDFLALSPNNRMPAIVDHDGPDGAPISMFESGAILQYLARKTGQFAGSTERERVAVEQWLMWQMGGVGPMAGQAHHFLKYAPNMEPPHDLPYAKDRYRTEVGRLYRVLDGQLAKGEFVAGDFYSIADMAIYPWVRGSKRLMTNHIWPAGLIRLPSGPALRLVVRSAWTAAKRVLTNRPKTFCSNVNKTI